MDRIALISTVIISLILGINGSLSTAKVAARKGYSPFLGTLAGGLVGLAGGMAMGIVLAGPLGRAGIHVGLLSGLGSLVLLFVLWTALPDRQLIQGNLPGGIALKLNIQARHIQGKIMRTLFLIAIGIALVALGTLLWTIVNKSYGLVITQYEVEPEDLTIGDVPTGRDLDDLSEAELERVLADGVRSALMRRFILETVLEAPQSQWAALSPLSVAEVLADHDYPQELADIPINKLDEAQGAQLLALNLAKDDLKDIVFREIIKPQIVKSWTLAESISKRSQINAIAAEDYPTADLSWHSWVSWDFLTSPLDPRRPDTTGIRPALYGSLLIIVITILVAFPVGVGAAIYLEEYASKNALNQIIQTNINNLAGVPSIIYGMLGLAIFVRTMEHVTSGNVVGTDTANGRTVLSAGFTLALLILPMVIINAQEAIRAVPGSLRQASYGLGATHWQTIWNHVLPYAMPGILTGTILAISRAIGETAPLILVGGATYLTRDPEGPFSIFTALPLLIYRWTTLPQAEFRNAAAAAIIVLLVLLLSLNSFAVILRNRFSRRLS